MSEPIRARPDGVEIAIRVQPGARRTECVGLHGNEVKIRIAAPPVGGKANTALTAFLAEQLGVPRSSVRLVVGATGRSKLVVVDGASVESARAALGVA